MHLANLCQKPRYFALPCTDSMFIKLENIEVNTVLANMPKAIQIDGVKVVDKF